MGPWSKRTILGAVLLSGTVGLSSAAQATESPAEPRDLCAPADNIWRRAARFRFAGYCARLDQARSNLRSRPALALKLSRAALTVHPADYAAQLIHAHALFAFGKNQAAHQAFAKWEQRHGSAPVFHVTHLWAAAQAAVRARDAASALQRYRRLLLSLNEFSFADERGRILVEASVSALFAGAPPMEALGYLRRSEQEYAPSIHLFRSALARVLSSETEGEVSGSVRPRDGQTDLYWALAEQVGLLQDVDVAQGEPELTWLTLPAGALHWLLGKLAAANDRQRAEEHRRALICSQPAQLAGLLSSWSGEAAADVDCGAEQVEGVGEAEVKGDR